MKFEIKGRLPGMNEIINTATTNRYAYAKMKKEYTELCAWCCKGLKANKQIDVTITWYEKNRRRDIDNVACGVKFLIDGMVLAKVIPNDGWKEIRSITHKFEVDKENPRIEVEVKE